MLLTKASPYGQTAYDMAHTAYDMAQTAYDMAHTVLCTHAIQVIPTNTHGRSVCVILYIHTHSWCLATCVYSVSRCHTHTHSLISTHPHPLLEYPTHTQHPTHTPPLCKCATRAHSLALSFTHAHTLSHINTHSIITNKDRGTIARRPTRCSPAPAAAHGGAQTRGISLIVLPMCCRPLS